MSPPCSSSLESIRRLTNPLVKSTEDDAVRIGPGVSGGRCATNHSSSRSSSSSSQVASFISSTPVSTSTSRLFWVLWSANACVSVSSAGQRGPPVRLSSSSFFQRRATTTNTFAKPAVAASIFHHTPVSSVAAAQSSSSSVCPSLSEFRHCSIPASTRTTTKKKQQQPSSSRRRRPQSVNPAVVAAAKRDEEEALLEAMKSTDQEWWMDPLAMFEDDNDDTNSNNVDSDPLDNLDIDWEDSFGGSVDKQFMYTDEHESPLPQQEVEPNTPLPDETKIMTAPHVEERSSAEILFESILPEEPSLFDPIKVDDNIVQLPRTSSSSGSLTDNSNQAAASSLSPPAQEIHQPLPPASTLFDDFVLDSMGGEIAVETTRTENQDNQYHLKQHQNEAAAAAAASSMDTERDELPILREQRPGAPPHDSSGWDLPSARGMENASDLDHYHQKAFGSNNSQSVRRQSAAPNASSQYQSLPPSWSQQQQQSSPPQKPNAEYGEREFIHRTIPTSAVGAATTTAPQHSLSSTTATIRGGLPPAASAAPLLLTLIPKVRSIVSGNTATTALLLWSAGRVLWHWTHHFRSAVVDNALPATSTLHKQKPLQDSIEEQPDENSRQHSQGNDDSSRRMQQQHGDNEDGDDDQDESMTDSESTNKQNQHDPLQRNGWFGKLFQSSGSASALNKITRQQHSTSRASLAEQLDDMKKRYADAETDKISMEKEYEKASWELQETLSELASLKTTTRHLQAQLTDNEEMLARAIRTERRKAKEELLRMKDAMVKVVEREREAMRDEFMKQAAELQFLWKQQQQQMEEQAADNGNEIIISKKVPPPPPSTIPTVTTDSGGLAEAENTHAV